MVTDWLVDLSSTSLSFPFEYYLSLPVEIPIGTYRDRIHFLYAFLWM